MQKINGKSAFTGIAIGQIKEFHKAESKIPQYRITDIEAELARFEAAKSTAISQLCSLYDEALEKVGEENAAIFEIHQMMLEDDDFLESIHDMIANQSMNAEYAVDETGKTFSTMFAEMDDEYMQARSADIKDISQRLLNILIGKNDTAVSAEDSEPYILLADDLSPSETIQLDRSKVLAFVTRFGSTTSHTAILARTMNIPALVSTEVDPLEDIKAAIVDGNAGILILDPDPETLKDYEAKVKKEQERKELLNKLKGQPSITEDGRKINLYANIGGIDDLDAVLANDSEGIGLFRSEFLYLQSNDYPSEDVQFEAYKTVAERMGEKKVIIRTLDIGADKQIDYFHLDHEDNPALGCRAVRICLQRPEIFKTQLRALYRASAYGNIAIMVPMIISVWEVQKVKEIAKEVQEELKKEGIPFKEVEFGIMIETPSAVIMADELAKEVDFFSMGTNDLTQYTLAIDRQNANLGMFFDSHHPAVLRMIQMVIDSAHKNGIWAGICGELAADTSLTETFVRMGVDELSMSPSMILPVRDKIIHTSYQ